MAWERRARGGAYYTRSVRGRSGRVVRLYLGCGEVAEAASVLDAAERARVVDARASRARERVAATATLDVLGAVDTEIAALLAEVFESAGYRYHRGEWRRTRKP